MLKYLSRDTRRGCKTHAKPCRKAPYRCRRTRMHIPEERKVFSPYVECLRKSVPLIGREGTYRDTTGEHRQPPHPGHFTGRQC